MPTVYLKRRPDGSPNTDGPAAHLPDDARFVHRQAAAWLDRSIPDLGQEGASLLAYIERVTPEPDGGWGDLLGTFAAHGQPQGDRAAIVRRRLAWLQAQPIQVVERIGAAILDLIDAARLTTDERGN
jgi:hypothetical protein